jgi:tetratricopeptide (TPR) repeat protein
MDFSWVLLLLLPVLDIDEARNLYKKSKYSETIQALRAIPPSDVEASMLRGKSYFGLRDFHKAQEIFESITRSNPDISEAFHWLGKTLGRRAETSSFLTAPRLASQCRQNFERAVALNPKNVLALNDLFEYSLEAPGFLGGGLDKASGIAARVAVLDPAEYQFAMARIAEKNNDFAAAEQHYRRAVELAPGDQGRIHDVARFLARRNRHAEGDAEFERSAKLDPNHPGLVFARAETYISSKRRLAEARQLLERYLKLEVGPDDPPREDAEKLLRRLPRN